MFFKSSHFMAALLAPAALAQTTTLSPSLGSAESRISTYFTHITAQPQFSSVLSVMATAVPASDLVSIQQNGVILSSYITAQTWFSRLPSDVKGQLISAASEVVKLVDTTSAPSKNAAPQETGSWRLVQGAMVGAAGAVAGMALI